MSLQKKNSGTVEIDAIADFENAPENNKECQYSRCWLSLVICKQ